MATVTPCSPTMNDLRPCKPANKNTKPSYVAHYATTVFVFAVVPAFAYAVCSVMIEVTMDWHTTRKVGNEFVAAHITKNTIKEYGGYANLSFFVLMWLEAMSMQRQQLQGQSTNSGLQNFYRQYVSTIVQHDWTTPFHLHDYVDCTNCSSETRAFLTSVTAVPSRVVVATNASVERTAAGFQLTTKNWTTDVDSHFCFFQGESEYENEAGFCVAPLERVVPTIRQALDTAVELCGRGVELLSCRITTKEDVEKAMTQTLRVVHQLQSVVNGSYVGLSSSWLDVTPGYRLDSQADQSSTWIWATSLLVGEQKQFGLSDRSDRFRQALLDELEATGVTSLLNHQFTLLPFNHNPGTYRSVGGGRVASSGAINVLPGPRVHPFSCDPNVLSTVPTVIGVDQVSSSLMKTSLQLFCAKLALANTIGSSDFSNRPPLAGSPSLVYEGSSTFYKSCFHHEINSNVRGYEFQRNWPTPNYWLYVPVSGPAELQKFAGLDQTAVASTSLVWSDDAQLGVFGWTDNNYYTYSLDYYRAAEITLVQVLLLAGLCLVVVDASYAGFYEKLGCAGLAVFNSSLTSLAGLLTLYYDWGTVSQRILLKNTFEDVWQLVDEAGLWTSLFVALSAVNNMTSRSLLGRDRCVTSNLMSLVIGAMNAAIGVVVIAHYPYSSVLVSDEDSMGHCSQKARFCYLEDTSTVYLVTLSIAMALHGLVMFAFIKVIDWCVRQKKIQVIELVPNGFVTCAYPAARELIQLSPLDLMSFRHQNEGYQVNFVFWARVGFLQVGGVLVRQRDLVFRTLDIWRTWVWLGGETNLTYTMWSISKGRVQHGVQTLVNGQAERHRAHEFVG